MLARRRRGSIIDLVMNSFHFLHFKVNNVVLEMDSVSSFIALI